MSLEDQFNNSAQEVQSLKSRPSNDQLLALYALFKQATEGDITGERPGGFDFKGAAKYDAWHKLTGTSREDAMKKYITLVQDLKEQLG